MRGDEPRQSTSPVVPDDVKSISAQAVGDPQRIGDQQFDAVVVDAVGTGARGVATLIGSACPVPGHRKCGHFGTPGVASLRKAMQQQDCRALIRARHVRGESKPVRLDNSVAHCCGICHGPCLFRRRIGAQHAVPAATVSGIPGGRPDRSPTI